MDTATLLRSWFLAQCATLQFGASLIRSGAAMVHDSLNQGRRVSEVTFIRHEPVAIENDSRPLLERSKRKRKRPPNERGLPERQVIEALYRAYRDTVDSQWRRLVGTDVLPEITPELVTQVATEYEQRHRTGQADTNALAVKLASFGLRKLGMIYARFSSRPK